jgi:superfamily II DNA or RNA helicase
MNVLFEGTLRLEQEEVKKEAIDYLSKNGSIMISIPTGSGKTITSINLACEIKLKTLVIVNKIVLIKQWVESILKVCPTAKIQQLTAKTEMKNENDFFIINAVNIDKKSKTFFRDIGLVIVDEAHLIIAETLSKSLQFLYPRYLIGLSATPYRTDGLDILLSHYFGEDKIVRLLKRNHIVYKVKTGFTPKTEMAVNGKINWGVLLDSQAMDEKRNELIISIVKKYKTRNILVLTKRIEQGEYLYNRLIEEKEYVTSLLGKQQDFDRDARVLVATTQKAGTGFDHAKLDCLILASDLQNYFIQALGRVLRRPDIEPIIFDLIDENRILDSHFKSRKKVYLEIGGKISNYTLAG